MSGLGDIATPLLSVELDLGKRGKFAHCYRCNTVYIDDIPQVGCIGCPRCEGGLLRDLHGVRAAEEYRRGLRLREIRAEIAVEKEDVD